MTAYDPQRAAQLHADAQAAGAGGLFRQTDPETSRDAAAKVAPHLTALQARVLAAFKAHGPMTAKQAEALAEFEDLGFSTVRKRISELARAGALVECGKADRMTRYRAQSASSAAA
jgi:DNA-binding MarR family transcriptional regulator